MPKDGLPAPGEARAAAPASKWRRWLPWATAAFILLAAVLVANVFRDVSWKTVQHSLTQLDGMRLGTAALCVFGSYVTLTCFDWLGTRHAGSRIAYPRVALAAFTALSIGHTVGLAPFSAGAVRYRFYSRWGMSAGQIATLILSSAITVTLGQLALASLVMLGRPGLAAKLLHLDPNLVRILGAVGILLLVGWVVASALIRRPVRIAQWSIALPPWRIAAAQVVAGAVNYTFIAAAIHRLLGPTVDYATVTTAYMLGNVAALVTHVPGGLGVLEAVMVGLLPGHDVIGPMIAFRALYFFIPLAIGLTLFGSIELALRLRRRS